jgi:hypothetical protein
MVMKNLDTVTLLCPHGLRSGDILTLNGKPVTVRAVVSPTVALVEPFGLLRSFWWWLSGLVCLRGFWARVWSR